MLQQLLKQHAVAGLQAAAIQPASGTEATIASPLLKSFARARVRSALRARFADDPVQHEATEQITGGSPAQPQAASEADAGSLSAEHQRLQASPPPVPATGEGESAIAIEAGGQHASQQGPARSDGRMQQGGNPAALLEQLNDTFSPVVASATMLGSTASTQVRRAVTSQEPHFAACSAQSAQGAPLRTDGLTLSGWCAVCRGQLSGVHRREQCSPTPSAARRRLCTL